MILRFLPVLLLSGCGIFGQTLVVLPPTIEPDIRTAKHGVPVVFRSGLLLAQDRISSYIDGVYGYLKRSLKNIKLNRVTVYPSHSLWEVVNGQVVPARGERGRISGREIKIEWQGDQGAEIYATLILRMSGWSEKMINQRYSIIEMAHNTGLRALRDAENRY